MKALRTLGLVVILAVALTACGNDGNSAGAAAANRAADDYEITQIVTKWHDAVTTKDLDLAMSLFADDAVFAIAGQSLSGKDEIRNFLGGQGAPFKPQNHWTSLTHTPNIRHTLSGDRGTLFFECHYFDTSTRQLVSSVSADSKVARIKGHWLFTSLAAGNAILG